MCNIHIQMFLIFIFLLAINRFGPLVVLTSRPFPWSFQSCFLPLLVASQLQGRARHSSHLLLLSILFLCLRHTFFFFLAFSLGCITEKTHHHHRQLSPIMTCECKWISKQSTTYHLYIMANSRFGGVFPIT